MVLFGNTNLLECPWAGLASHQERDHAGDVGLIGEHLQIEHEVHIVFERLWNVIGARW
jgi:hypothetical protein